MRRQAVQLVRSVDQWIIVVPSLSMRLEPVQRALRVEGAAELREEGHVPPCPVNAEERALPPGGSDRDEGLRMTARRVAEAGRLSTREDDRFH